MKKLAITLIILGSFLMGNVSMVVSIIKIFGTDALLPVDKDLITRRIEKAFWGVPPRRSPLGTVTYDAVVRERHLQEVAEGRRQP